MSYAIQNLLTAIRLIKQRNAHCKGFGEYFAFALKNAVRFDEARAAFFTDAASQHIFDWQMQYLAVHSFLNDHEQCTLPNAPISPEKWAELENKAASMTRGFAADDYMIDRVDTWFLESYALKGFCEAAPGDIVLDCGTFTGNTSLYFAKKVGPTGHVYGFEGSSATYRKFAKNTTLVDNISAIHAAVNDTCGTVHFSGSDPGSRVFAAGEKVPALTLDSFVEQQQLPRVDFIKMDIESGEKRALLGAQKILQRFKPRMTISGYHLPNDLIELPALIHQLCPHYTFRLGHYHTTNCETVIFCSPGPEPVEYNLTHILNLETPPAPAGISAQEYAELLDFVASSHAGLEKLCIYSDTAKQQLALMESLTKEFGKQVSINNDQQVEIHALRNLLREKEKTQ